MTCSCIPCSECEGTGNVWRSFHGEYLGNHRSDDLDEIETCEECNGSGVFETCDECREAEEREEWEEYKTAEPGLTLCQREEVDQIITDRLNAMK